MGWRERLLRGTFRNAPFKLDENTQSGGRRKVIHEFPHRDNAFIEDNGAKVKTFDLQLYVVGDDYDIDRDRLESALGDHSTPGILVHPRKGSLLVSVTDYSYSESTAEGGVARFDVSFVLEDAQQQPTPFIDTQRVVSDSADAAIEAIKTNFVSTYNTQGLPQFVSESADNRLKEFVSSLSSLNGRLSGAQQPISDFTVDLANLGDESASLIRQPANLVNRIVGVIGAIAGIANDVSAALNIYATLSNVVEPQAPAFNTPSREQENANLKAMNGLQAQAVAVEAARATSTMTFDSVNQATTVRDRILILLDTQMLVAGDDAYLAMRDLRAKMVEDIRARGSNLSRIDQFTPVYSSPSLVLAYEIYGSHKQEPDLLKRNAIDHPAFIQGGKPLEVLSRG